MSCGRKQTLFLGVQAGHSSSSLESSNDLPSSPFIFSNLSFNPSSTPPASLSSTGSPSRRRLEAEADLKGFDPLLSPDEEMAQLESELINKVGL